MGSARTPESPHSQPAAAVPGPRLVKLAGLLEDWQADAEAAHQAKTTGKSGGLDVREELAKADQKGGKVSKRYTQQTCPKSDTWFAEGGRCGWAHCCAECDHLGQVFVPGLDSDGSEPMPTEEVRPDVEVLDAVAYLAGPYRDPRGAYWVRENIRTAERVALQLWQHGLPTLCPHLNTALWDGAGPDDLWLHGDLIMLSRCDLVILGPGWQHSPGAQAERAKADQIGIPVLEWADGLNLEAILALAGRISEGINAGLGGNVRGVRAPAGTTGPAGAGGV